MGAERKGPLAAFIVVAVIAAILLTTSVRSQAATAWLGRALPSAPGVVRAVGGGLDHVVEQGAALVHETGLVTPPDARGTSATEVDAPVGPTTAPSSTAPPTTAPPSHRVPVRRAHLVSRPRTGHSAAPPPTATTVTAAPVAVGHGRHLGWVHSRHARADHGAREHGPREHGRPDHGRPEHGRPDHGHPDHGHPDHGRHLGQLR